MLTQSYSAADFLHGPIAMLTEEFPVIAIGIKGPAMADMHAMIFEIIEHKAEIAVISNDKKIINELEHSISLPANLPEWLSPIVAVIPGQLLALKLALVKGHDPDNPRGLSKVTRTL